MVILVKLVLQKNQFAVSVEANMTLNNAKVRMIFIKSHAVTAQDIIEMGMIMISGIVQYQMKVRIEE